MFGRLGGRRSARGRSLFSPRLLIALVIAGISLFSYYAASSRNPVTDEVQHVSMSPEQEIAMGLQAAPKMADQHGGLHSNREAQELVDDIGNQLVSVSTLAGKTEYPFEFHVLADEQTINAFALPGGQVFVTAGLLGRLDSDGKIAGVLAHEIGHVIERHGAEHLAKAQLTQGLTGAAVIAAYDPDNPRSYQSAAVAMAIGQLVNMKFGRDDELEADRWGVRLTAEAGYDPRSMIGVMEVLAEASQGQKPPEFFSTHPDPGRRIERIEQAIRESFPDGIPEDLKP